jgi:hypothetical protein
MKTQTNLVSQSNKSYLSYKMLAMVDKINYMISIESIMSMFIFCSEEVELSVFSFLLSECQNYNENIELFIKTSSHEPQQ